MSEPTRRQRGQRIKMRGQTARERDAIALGVIEAYMDALYTGHMLCPRCGEDHPVKEITGPAATLMRARYDKLRPSLSAVEQTLVDDRDKLTHEQVIEQVTGFVLANADSVRAWLAGNPTTQH